MVRASVLAALLALAAALAPATAIPQQDHCHRSDEPYCLRCIVVIAPVVGTAQPSRPHRMGESPQRPVKVSVGPDVPAGYRSRAPPLTAFPR